MLPEVGALEYLIIAAVALIVVGPKDLPVLLRQLGQFLAKLRGMASEFRASFDEMARQSELDDLRKEVEAMRKGQFLDMAGHDEMMKSVDDIQHSLNDVGVDFHQGPETYNYDAEVAAQTPQLTIGEGPKPQKKPRAKAKPNGAAKPAAKPVAKAAAKPKPAPKTAPPKTVAGRTPRPKKTAGADA